MKKIGLCLLMLIFGISEVSGSYPDYQEYPDQGIKGKGEYIRFAKKIKKNEIKTILEIGSRDALDAIELSNLYHCHVFAFECNPTAIEICKQNIGLNPNVTLVPLGVWDTTGEMPFYRIINTNIDTNIGASSFFEFNPEAKNYPSIVEEGLVQEKITVPTIRLDEFLKAQDIRNIDLLCMDVQGAAFQVLFSLGEQLKTVKYIIVELENHPIYSGEVLYKDVNDFLAQAGFRRASNLVDGLFGDVLYINSLLLQAEKKSKKLRN